MVHVKVVVALVQLLGDVEMAAQVVEADRVLMGAVLLSSHLMPLPLSPGTATRVAELHAWAGPVMVGGAGLGYRVMVCIPLIATGQ